ncbi:hypothetical protein LJB42_002895 [Komagataella kurtzmanii]|nr:hypothetical protein LJB42_002895 [Komagataella kurtzmanii]
MYQSLLVLSLICFSSANFVKLRSNAGMFYDTMAGVPRSDEEFWLRLDINQGLSWTLDSSYYSCNGSNVSSSLCFNSARNVYDASNSPTADFVDVYANTTVNNTDEASAERVNLTNNLFADGVYMEDNFYVTLNNRARMTATDLKFLNAHNSSAAVGSLALGSYTSQDVPTFLQRLQSGGLIESNSFSLALNEIDSSYGELYLGTINSTKYVEPLVEFDFIPVSDPNGVFGFDWEDTFPTVPISGLSMSSNDKQRTVFFPNDWNNTVLTGTYPLPMMLDSRNIFIHLPFSSIIHIAVQLNALYLDTLQKWAVNCSVGQLDATLNFHMGNLTVHAPIKELIYPAYQGDKRLSFANGEDVCILAMAPDVYIGYPLLGTPFLRNAVVAVNHDSKKVAVANLNRDSIPPSSNVSVSESMGVYVPPPVSTSRTSERPSTLDESSTANFDKREESDVSSSSVTNSNSRNSSTITSSGTQTEQTSGIATIETDSIPGALGNNLTDYSTLTLTIYTNSEVDELNPNIATASISNGSIYSEPYPFSGTAVAESFSASPSQAEGSNSSSSGSSLVLCFFTSLASLLTVSCLLL